MGKKLSSIENKIYERVDEVLYYLWDPIGVSNSPGTRDEYYPYIPEIFSALMDAGNTPGDKKKIIDRLLTLQHKHMGLSVDENSKEKAEKIV
jgi:hypothetical protein